MTIIKPQNTRKINEKKTIKTITVIVNSKNFKKNSFENFRIKTLKKLLSLYDFKFKAGKTHLIRISNIVT